ncbi:hypothetical protein [Afipia felis]|nr:hypothetical protein [Afipia felis]
MGNGPLALIGAVVALWIAGQPLLTGTSVISIPSEPKDAGRSSPLSQAKFN